MSEALNIYAGPCQYCMDGRDKAQLILCEGAWQPWPLVASLPPHDAMILCDVCPECDRERFNTEEVPRLNDKISARNSRAATKGE